MWIIVMKLMNLISYRTGGWKEQALSDSSELSTLSILHDPGLTRPWENCAVFLISQTRNLQLNALPRAIHLARVRLEFEPSFCPLRPVFLLTPPKGKAHSPATPDKRCCFACKRGQAHACMCFWLWLSQILQFLYKVIRVEVYTEIQVEWFAALERHY